MPNFVPVSNVTQGETLNAGDELFLGFNQSAVDTTVNDGGLVDVDGGTAIGTIVNGGGVQSAISGGTTSDTIVNGGGVETLIEGSTATGTTVNNGGSQVVDGFCTVSDTTVNAGGFQVLSGNSTAFGTIISSGGYMVVSSGFFGSPAKAIDTAVRAGGVIDVTYLGYAAGGVASVGAGDTLSVTVSGQTYAQTLAGDYTGDYFHLSADGSGGTDVTVNGLFAVSSGQTVRGSSYANGHGLVVLSGGSAVDITLGDGGSIVVSGGTAVSTTVGNGGSEIVENGGTASDTTVQPGGTEVVSSGGTTTSTTVNDGGVQIVSAGGSSLDTTVNSGDAEIVAAGGTAISTTVNDGGLLVVLPGGTATGTNVSGGTVVSTGLVLDETGTGAVFLGATADGTTVSNGATEFVLSDGMATALTVDAGGTEAVYAGGVASDTDLLIGGVLDIAYLPFAVGGSASVSGGDMLTVSVGGSDYTQKLMGDYADTTFALSADGAGLGTDVTAAPCYCQGTLILTEHGEVPVEDLHIGDRLVTHLGAVRPIRWIGFRRLSIGRHPAPRDVCPIRIVAGALGAGIPRRDLLVSPDHAILLHGRLVPARLLLNGATVRREDGAADVTYFHIELGTHDILLAEGAAAESYLDTGNRAAFENAGLPPRLHPDFAGDQVRREAGTCAPLATASGDVEPIWRGLAARAQALGWTLPDAPDLVDDPDLHIVADGRRIDAAVAEDGRYVFAVPACNQPPRLVSRAARPSDLCAWLDDRRRLGVQVRRMILHLGQDVADIPMDHPMLAEGWWAGEQDDGAPCRWTDGDAGLPATGFGLIEIRLAGRARYPASGQRFSAIPPGRWQTARRGDLRPEVAYALDACGALSGME
jgi:autotransporter passenger strand-loop-strand repeat protein